MFKTKMNHSFLTIFFFTSLLKFSIATHYIPPQALVEPLKPIGLRISIPDEEGISLVAFHVKFNEEFDGLETGTIAKDILKQKNGRWTYQDKNSRLSKNDIVYYWVHVVYNGLGYNLVDQKFKVTDFYDYNGQKISVQTTTTTLSYDIPLNIDDTQSCVPSETILYNEQGEYRNPCANELLFSDDFRDAAQFRKSQWTVVEQFSEAPDYEFVVYRNDPENIYVRNGLRITPKLLQEEFGEAFIREGNLTLQRCTKHPKSSDCQRKAQSWNILPPVTSGRINTKKFLQFQYGHIEIKAKLPRGDWIYPVLMLAPTQNSNKNNHVQIRIASACGNAVLKTQDESDISGHILWGGVTGKNTRESTNRILEGRSTKYSRDLWSDAYHTYEIFWRPGNIVLRVDGQIYEDKTVNVPIESSYYLIIGVAVGGLSEFPDYSISGGYNPYLKPWRNVQVKATLNFFNATNTWYKTWPKDDTSLRIDYVKVWAL